jgi:dipeptidyl aminopeptidase/acylaminoacyl peptidase
LSRPKLSWLSTSTFFLLTSVTLVLMKKKAWRTARILLLMVTTIVLPAMAQQSTSDTVMDAVFAVRRFRQVALSPDGKRVAWVEQLRGPNGVPSGNSAIYTALVANPAKPRRITAGGGDHSEHDLAWSSDSRQIAFLSDAESPGQLQLFVADAQAGEARQLTHAQGYLSSPQWSPDGKMLALLYIENAPRAAGPLVAMSPAVGLIEEKIFEQRLATVDPASGEMKQISPPDMYVYEYDWSPDGQRFAATAAHGSGDNNWWIAQLYTLPAAGGEMKAIHKPALQMNLPRWSPDGRRIAYIGGIMSDFGSIGGDIYVVPAEGGAVRNLTPGMKSSPAWLDWLPSGQILFAQNVDGESGLATLDPATGAVKPVWNAPEVISAGEWGISVSVARDGLATAFVRSSFQHPQEVWAGATGSWTQITRLNQNAKPMWGDGRKLHWTSGGLNVQGWLLYPHNYESTRKYPLVVDVHGGPAGACLPGWPGYPFQAPLAAQGYFVLCPNPRGSFGQGESFTQGNIKDFGYGDFRDILAGVEAAVKQAPIDPQRVGITGWSYGGYMTMWAVTQTTRFRAAVAGAGLANWLSYYGENDIDEWMIPYFGASVYDDPQVYAKSAPITFIKQAKTPTLVLVGERDGECPAPQSFEFWHALKWLGVPTQLVVYPNEGHAISDPEHQRDIVRRLVDWFGKYMPEAQPSAVGR